MNYGKVEERSSSRSRSPNTARRAATSAILTDILSRSDRARTSRTADARPGKSILIVPERVVRDSAKGPISSRCRLDSDLVIYGCGDTLRAAEVALSRLDRHIAEEKLNMLQFTPRRPHKT